MSAVYQRLWAPLFALKFFEYADNISAAWIWTRIKRVGTSRRSMFQEIGFSRSDITLQFTLEGFLAIAAGAAAGFLVAAGAIGLLHATGVRNHSIFWSYMIGSGFRPDFHAYKILRVVGVFLAVAVLAPLFPAIRGGRLSILKTLEKR